jgi:hypothetical protein
MLENVWVLELFFSYKSLDESLECRLDWRSCTRKQNLAVVASVCGVVSCIVHTRERILFELQRRSHVWRGQDLELQERSF